MNEYEYIMTCCKGTNVLLLTSQEDFLIITM